MAGFLEKLRSADNATKTRWIILFTSVAMAIVLYVWLAYFNTLFSSLDNSSATATAMNQNGTSQEIEHMSPTILERIGSVYHAFTDVIGNMLKLRKEYIIKPN